MDLKGVRLEVVNLNYANPEVRTIRRLGEEEPPLRCQRSQWVEQQEKTTQCFSALCSPAKQSSVSVFLKRLNLLKETEPTLNLPLVMMWPLLLGEWCLTPAHLFPPLSYRIPSMAPYAACTGLPRGLKLFNFPELCDRFLKACYII